MWSLFAQNAELIQQAQASIEKANSDSHTALWLAITGCAVSIVGLVVNLFRDKHRLEHDSERVQMKADLRHLTSKVDDCEEDRDEIKKELAALTHKVKVIDPTDPTTK